MQNKLNHHNTQYLNESALVVVEDNLQYKAFDAFDKIHEKELSRTHAS
jgi:hypothetical protein